MSMIKSLEMLRQKKTEARAALGLDKQDRGTTVFVGLATCGIAAGAKPVMDTLRAAVEKQGLSGIQVKQTGCIGICQYEPVVEVVTGTSRVTYVNITPEKAARIAEEHLAGQRVVTEYTIGANVK